MYEYKVVDTNKLGKELKNAQTIEAYLNEMADQGWRLWSGENFAFKILWEREKN